MIRISWRNQAVLFCCCTRICEDTKKRKWLKNWKFRIPYFYPCTLQRHNALWPGIKEEICVSFSLPFLIFYYPLFQLCTRNRNRLISVKNGWRYRDAPFFFISFRAGIYVKFSKQKEILSILCTTRNNLGLCIYRTISRKRDELWELKYEVVIWYFYYTIQKNIWGMMILLFFNIFF